MTRAHQRGGALRDLAGYLTRTRCGSVRTRSSGGRFTPCIQRYVLTRDHPLLLSAQKSRVMSPGGGGVIRERSSRCSHSTHTHERRRAIVRLGATFARIRACIHHTRRQDEVANVPSIVSRCYWPEKISVKLRPSLRYHLGVEFHK